MDKKINVKKVIIKLSISLLVIGLIIFAFYLVLKHFGLTDLSQERIQEIINNSGALAPIIFILITFLQVTFIPIPSTITVVVGDYLFGFWVSYLYSFIGMMVGSMLAFYLGRILGKKFVYWIAGEKEIVDEYLHKLKGRENVLLFFMFLFPFFPDDLLCMVAGILPISGFGFFLMQCFTRMVTIGVTLLMLSGEVIPLNQIGIPIIVMLCIIFGVIFYICYKNAEKINDLFVNLLNKIFKKNNK